MNGKYLYIRFSIFAGAIIAAIVFLVLLVSYSSSENRHYDITVTDLSEGWFDNDGSKQSLYALPNGELELTKDVSSLDLKNMRFCTKTVDTYFELFADGTKIYDYYYNQSSLAGKSYGMNMHMVTLPENTNKLTLKLLPIFDEDPAVLMDTVIADAGMYMGNVFKGGMFNFSLCVVMFVIGITTIIIGLSGQMKAEFISLGITACLTALWSVNETMILQIMTQKPEIIRAISYISFSLIPYPPAAFLSKITGNRKQWPVLALVCAVVLCFILCIVLNVTGISDFHYTAAVSRIIIFISVTICLWFTVSAFRRKEISRTLMKNLIVSVTIAVAGVVIDIVRYLFTDSVFLGVGLFTRIGIFIFLLIFIRYIISDYRRTRIESEKAEVMMKLAYTDALTGLKNRLAFNEREKQLKSARKSNCIIIQMDVNNLKVVNDVHGHTEGDRHIRAAADCILESLGEYGDCYRTGGDEFIAVISPYKSETEIQKAVENIGVFCNRYNDSEKPPVKLQIACGYAKCDDASAQLEKIELLADQRMYERKKKMKKESPIV